MYQTSDENSAEFLLQSLKKAEEKNRALARELNDLRRLKEANAKIFGELDRQKEQLKREKAKDEALVASIGDGFIATNHEERVVLMNKQAESMLGLKATRAKGKRWSDIQKEEDEKGNLIIPSKRLIHRALATGTKRTSDTAHPSYYVRKDGSKFPVAITTSPIILQKKIIGAIIIFRDITREHAVDRAKTEFVSLAAHQLGAPLSTMSWYTETIMSQDMGELNAEQLKFIGDIYTVIQRMISLVNTLLNVSRIDLGTFSIIPEPTDLAKLANIIVSEFSHEIKEKEILFETAFNNNLPLVNVDPHLMQIVFQNLISNALKYTAQKGSIRFTIEKGAGKDINMIIITVTDTGCGIPEYQQDKIGTKLFRADNALANKSEGTGLGLYIVKAIAERSGGKMWFQSIENKGTTFFVSFPLSGMKQKEGVKGLV